MTTATLGITVQSGQAVTAAADLDKLVVAADKAEKGTKRVGGASKEMAAALGSISSILTKIESNTATMAAGLNKSATAALSLGTATGIVAASLRNMDTVTAKVTMDMTGMKVEATSVSAALNQEAKAVTGVTAALAANTKAANENKTAVVGRAAAVNNTSGRQSFNTSNVAAQFQDIGVTAAMGMSPMMIALQQGTQLSAVLGGQGLTGVVRTLGAAFASVFSPVSLLTIGVVALGAAGIQAFMGWISTSGKAKNGIDSITQSLAEQAGPVDAIKGRISELQSITDAYAKAIRGTAKDQDIATKSIIANSEREFNAKKSLLELELKRQQAAIAVQEAEIGIAGRNLARDVRAATPTGIVDPVAGGFADPRVGQFVRSPQQANLTSRTQELIAANPINDQLKEMRANLELAKIGTEGLGDALGTTFNEGVATSIGRIASTATTATETAEKKYRDLIRLAQQRIDMAGVEQSTIGMTTESIARMTIRQELLNRAANDHISLLPEQTEQITRLASGIAAAEEMTRRLTEIYTVGKDIFSNFFSDMKSGLKEGQTFWEALGNAGLNALDKIASKALDMATNGIFDMIFGSIMGGLGGGNSLGGGWGVAGGFGGNGIFGIPGMATGGTVGRAGLSWVGEQGPELLRLPQGAQVIPNGPSMAMASNQNQSNDNRQVTVRLLMPDGWKAEILEEAGSNAVEIVQANDKAQRNYRQNGG